MSMELIEFLAPVKEPLRNLALFYSKPTRLVISDSDYLTVLLVPIFGSS